MVKWSSSIEFELVARSWRRRRIVRVDNNNNSTTHHRTTHSIIMSISPGGGASSDEVILSPVLVQNFQQGLFVLVLLARNVRAPHEQPEEVSGTV